MPTGLLRPLVLKKVQARRKELSAKVVAVTGTAGKTTTKAMIASILNLEHKLVCTSGNANLPPHVASYIWKADPTTEVMVLEMGMDRRGHIAQSSLMALPDVAVVTNVSRGHIEKCGGFEGVIKAKSEIIRGMGPKSILVLNADDLGSKRLILRSFRGRIITYGQDAKANYRVTGCRSVGMRLIVSISGEGVSDTYTLPTIGQHNGHNAAAAIAAARALGVPWQVIKQGLASFKRPRGRLTPVRGLNGSLLIDDSFNANPLSVGEGLRAMASIAKGRKMLAVLGNMEEQGKEWRNAHRQVGRDVAALGIDTLVTVGRKARYIAYSAKAAGMSPKHVHIFRKRQDALEFLKNRMTNDSVVLLKGSHSANIHKMVESLAFGDGGNGTQLY